MGRTHETILLTERQLAILHAVIEEYIASAEPVSSATIAEHPAVRASSATVRNEMARLEELGMLLQPHTSAGRIPTDLGYRYYVDHLMTQFQLHRRAPSARPQSIASGLEATCKMLGDLTRYIALAIAPDWQEHRLQHLELAPVAEDQLLMMLVTDSRQVLHSLTTVQERPTPAQLRQLNDLLNQEFVGKPLTALTEEALAVALTKLPHTQNDFYRQAPDIVRRGLEQDTASRIYVEGTTHIFEQREFSEMPKLRALMEALHEESVFEKLFARTHHGEIQVSIGAENPHPGLEDCAVVFTSYQISEHATGRIGVLGPKRMKYAQVIRTVDAVVHNLDRRLGTAQSDGETSDN